MVAGGVGTERRGGTTVLTLNHPPSNALTPVLRAALLAALTGQDKDCRAIVIVGAGVNFSGVLPLDPDHAAPPLAALCRAVETSPVPVIAALHGLVMGPGTELALAAQARIAVSDTRIALPEIALGLCPEGGSTQRLPHLVGGAEALRMLTTGRAVPASEALTLGLIDGIADGTPLEAALRLAAAMAEGRRFPRKAPDPVAWRNAVAVARREVPQSHPGVARVIDCVEAALLLPPENALAFEAVCREDLETSPEVAALRSAARAERRAATLPPAVARLHPSPVNRIGLVGAGADLLALARLALAKGLAVTWAFPGAGAEAEALAALDAAQEVDQRAGRLSPRQRAEDRARLTLTLDPAGLAEAGLQVHDSPGTLRPVNGATALLVLNGAEGEIGLGLAPSLRVSELSILAEEAPQSIATAVATLRRIGLPPVLVGQHPVLGRRVAAAGEAALARLAESGVPRRLLATALEAFGARLPDGLVSDSPAPFRAMPAGEVTNRWLAAMANEALHLLDAGIARRPSDVDQLMVAGYAFPRWRGGPMHQADQRGLLVLRHELRLWAEEDRIWAPAPLLDRLIQDGLRLGSLDG